MHQHPRQPLRPFSPSASPRLTSTANTSGDSMSVRTYSTEDLSAASQSVRSPDGKEPTPKDRASLVVQHFFTKTALIICSSRVSLPPAVSKNGEAKMDRWVRIFHLKPIPLYNHAHLLDHSSPLRHQRASLGLGCPLFWRNRQVFHCQVFLCFSGNVVYVLSRFRAPNYQTQTSTSSLT